MLEINVYGLFTIVRRTSNHHIYYIYHIYFFSDQLFCNRTIYHRPIHFSFCRKVNEAVVNSSIIKNLQKILRNKKTIKSVKQ